MVFESKRGREAREESVWDLEDLGLVFDMFDQDNEFISADACDCVRSVGGLGECVP